MIQIIERNQSISSQIKRQYDGRPQISYNSDNCIVIRLKDGDSDMLVCLNQMTSQMLIKFIQCDLDKNVLLNY
jgi:hypothetical protein